MQGLPEPGRLVLIKPLPGKLVPEEGSTTWVPPGGVYRPWSAHFAAMLMAGGLEWPHPAPRWGEQVHLRPVAEGAKVGDAAVPGHGIVTAWCHELAQKVVAGVLHPPRALPIPGEPRRIIDLHAREPKNRLGWVEWATDHLEALAKGLIDFGPVEEAPPKQEPAAPAAAEVQ